MNDRLAMSVTHADGRVTRWGPDEPNATDIPGDLTFSTSIPGGFKDLSCSLLRRIDVDYADQALFDTVKVYGPGNRTAWEGRMAQFPRSHGQGFQIVPGAVGWVSHLEDFPAFREIYIDRDLSRWRAPSLSRNNTLVAIPADVGAMSIGTALDSTAYGFYTTIGTVPFTKPIGEIWYDAGPGLKIATVRVKSILVGFGLPDASLANNIATSTDDSTTSATSDLKAVNGSDTSWSPTAARYVLFSLFWSGSSGGTAGTTYGVKWQRVSVVGNHGLSLHGSGPLDDGVYASEVITDIISRGAPLLTASSSTIQATSFAIPHLLFDEPTKPSDAISAVNAYHLYDWGVYDSRAFFFRQPDPTRLTWQARLSSGAFLDLEGDTAAQIFNGVIVRYTDPLGQRKIAGPPASNWPSSTALCDVTDSTLVDSSLTNPATAHGITRRWGILDIGFTTTDAGAVQLGYVWLAEHSLPQRRGNLNLTGTVTHPTEGDVPVWRVRAGDYISISDHPADVPRKIIETSYTHGTRTLSCSLDNTSQKLDAILERIGVQMVGVL